MQKIIISGAAFFVGMLVLTVAQDKGLIETNILGAKTTKECAHITSGEVQDTLGNTIEMGADEFGYNYQAHSFNGTYDSSDRVIDGTYYGQTGDYVDDKLQMKWSQEWLANVDCDGDGLLDRGLINGAVTGYSRGWTTNHVNGDYTDDNGNDQHYTYNVKIGWVGAEEGDLWGQYTILQENYQDPTGMIHERYATPGLGQNARWTEL